MNKNITVIYNELLEIIDGILRIYDPITVAHSSHKIDMDNGNTLIINIITGAVITLTLSINRSSPERFYFRYISSDRIGKSKTIMIDEGEMIEIVTLLEDKLNVNLLTEMPQYEQ